MNSLSEPGFLHRLLRSGGHESWDRLVDICTPLIFFWGCRMGLPAPEASELVRGSLKGLQDEFPRMRDDPAPRFAPTLTGLVLNRLNDILRARFVSAPPEAAALFDAEYRKHLIGRTLEFLQGEFDPAIWQAFAAQVLEGKKPETVAEACGTSLDSVLTSRSRVLRRLRQELAGMLEGI